MRLFTNRKFVLNLVLILSILQIVVPFLHAHYEQETSNQYGIHMHEINIGSVENQNSNAKLIKHTSLQSYHSEIENIDIEHPNNNKLNIGDFLAIFLLIIFALFVSTFHMFWPTTVAPLPCLSYRLSFARAPPSF